MCEPHQPPVTHMLYYYLYIYVQYVFSNAAKKADFTSANRRIAGLGQNLFPKQTNRPCTVLVIYIYLK